jgi:hypothetical protein
MPAQASLRSLRKLGCERGHDEAGYLFGTARQNLPVTAGIDSKRPPFRGRPFLLSH